MRFTAAEVFRSTIRQAPELHRQPPEPQEIALIFNDALLELVSEVVDMDEERLAARHVLPAWVVAADPIDLTQYGDEGDPSEREWLYIAYIDWLDSNEEGQEVYLTTLEARHRGQSEYENAVVGYLSDQRRKLHKVEGWGSVEELAIYGVPTPERVTPAAIDTLEFDFPSALRAALRWELLVGLAGFAGIADGRIAQWEGRRAEARARLEADAQSVGSIIEDVPLGYQI